MFKVPVICDRQQRVIKYHKKSKITPPYYTVNKKMKKSSRTRSRSVYCSLVRLALWYQLLLCLSGLILYSCYQSQGYPAVYLPGLVCVSMSLCSSSPSLCSYNSAWSTVPVLTSSLSLSLLMLSVNFALAPYHLIHPSSLRYLFLLLPRLLIIYSVCLSTSYVFSLLP